MVVVKAVHPLVENPFWAFEDGAASVRGCGVTMAFRIEVIPECCWPSIRKDDTLMQWGNIGSPTSSLDIVQPCHECAHHVSVVFKVFSEKQHFAIVVSIFGKLEIPPRLHCWKQKLSLSLEILGHFARVSLYIFVYFNALSAIYSGVGRVLRTSRSVGGLRNKTDFHHGLLHYMVKQGTLMFSYFLATYITTRMPRQK